MSSLTINDDTDPDSAFVRYGRLSCLVMKEGTQVLQKYILQNLPRHLSLHDCLTHNQMCFDNLKKQRKLTSTQYNILFPMDDSGFAVDQIDLTLWIIIGRNLVPEVRINDWKEWPNDDQKNPGHDFVRLREIRNKLSHMSVPELDYATYCEIWGVVSGALLRLGATKENIDFYGERDLDPETTRKCLMEMKEQSLEELFHVYIRETRSKRYVKRAVTIFVIVAFILAIAIVVPIVVLLRPKLPCSYYQKSVHTEHDNIAYMPREGWGAKKPKGLSRLDHPVPYVLITDSATGQRCHIADDCCASMKTMQDFFMTHTDYGDIPFSYVIGNDGMVYEGRGAEYAPNDTTNLATQSIIIAIDGTFYFGKPQDYVMIAAFALLNYLVEENYVKENFTLYAMCQINSRLPCSPGPDIYSEIQSWRNWDDFTSKDCYCANNTGDCSVL